MGLDRLRQDPDFDIRVLSVVSEIEAVKLCQKYNVEWVICDNAPLGKKKNFGLQAAKKMDFDFLLEIGSDDLILSMDQYKVWTQKKTSVFLGVHDMAFIDTETGCCRRWISASTFGAGRIISRDVLELANWKLWDDNISRGLDNNSVARLEKLGVEFLQMPPEDYPRVVDVKGKENLWAFNHLHGIEYNIENITKRLSEPEIEQLGKCLAA
jgi:hypothetical protein